MMENVCYHHNHIFWIFEFWKNGLFGETENPKCKTAVTKNENVKLPMCNRLMKIGYTIPSASNLGANIDVELDYKFWRKMDLGRYTQKFPSYFGENISAKFVYIWKFCVKRNLEFSSRFRQSKYKFLRKYDSLQFLSKWLQTLVAKYCKHELS